MTGDFINKNLITDTDREMLHRLRETLAEVTPVLHDADKHELANDLNYRVGYVTGLVLKLGNSYKVLSDNVKQVLQRDV